MVQLSSTKGIIYSEHRRSEKLREYIILTLCIRFSYHINYIQSIVGCCLLFVCLSVCVCEFVQKTRRARRLKIAHRGTFLLRQISVHF